MTNQEILKIAMAQSAVDLCAEPLDFEKNENVVVLSRENDGARRYLKLPFSCQLVSYGNNVVASVSPVFREIAEIYINKYNNGAEAWESLQSIGGRIPNFNIFGINFGSTPGLEGNYVLLLVPVLTFVVYFFSMRISRKFMYQPTQAEGNDRQAACSNTMMDVSMPLMSTFFAFAVPAIVGVYWMFRSVLGTLKQYIMSRVMPLPQFTEEDYKAAAREMAGKAPKKVEKSDRVGTVRSLHHIDDEDYEDTRERAKKREEAIAAKEKAEKAEMAKKTPFSAPTLKPDREEEKKSEASAEEKTEEPESNEDAQN